MAVSALGFAGASAGLDILSGLFGYFASEQAADMAESRGRMLRLEADTEATRYAEQAQGFKATQKLAFLKSGVQLTGAPLDIIDRDILTAQENISAIRARGAAGQLDAEGQAAQARAGGRQALLSSITGGFGKLALAGYMSGKNTKDIEKARATLGRDRENLWGSGIGSSTWLEAEGWR